MPRSITSPDRLFDRTWRPGHPFSPRLSATRKWGMGLLFILLCAIIGGYAFITESGRVKQMAEEALTDVLGGRVTVGSATLSVFEGLRLDDIKLLVDDHRSEQRDDSVFFSAATFLVQHNPAALLSGRIQPTRIVAIDPHLYLTEDAETGRWNYQRLARRSPPATTPTRPTTDPFAAQVLPEIALRNAKVQYAQRVGGKLTPLGSIEMEGQLTPALESQVYLFKLQSRGQNEGVGPTVDGRIAMGTRQVTASLMNFQFGRDVQTMLPAPVRAWWEAHQLNGRVNVPELYYKPTGEWDKPEFRVAVDLKGVTLQVSPEEWMSKQEQRRVKWMSESLQVMRLAGLNTRGFVDHIASVVTPTPIKLQKVSGRFVFTDKEGIEIQDVTGHVENNGLKINGRMRAYAPERPGVPETIRISSLDTEDIVVPPAPRYINSMPDVVREIYDHLRPQGRCSFWVEVARPEPGGRLKMNGEINILDGQFVFDKFPYPVRKATGKLVFGNNPKNGWEQLEIVALRGRGIEGGPNENADLRISGLISPFGPETGVTVNISGENIYSEPPLFAAFPPETREALKLFDAPGKGEFPKFRGGFECDVHRPVGLRQRWDIESRIRLDEATGRMVVFPYPMEGVSGRLTVRDDSVKIENAVMNRGGASLRMDGRVSWHSTPGPSDEEEHILRPRPAHPAGRTPTSRMLPPRLADTRPIDTPPLQPELTIVARDVPIDKDLLESLPADQRQWLEKIGMTGKLDIDGVVRNAPPSAKDPRGAEIDLDLNIAVKDGALWPVAGTPTVNDLAGRLRLRPQRIDVSELIGKRGNADVLGRGSVNWAGGAPQVVFNAEARNLLLDPPLYAMLPAPAKAGWDQVRPEGTVDARLSYSGKVSSSTDGPPESSSGYEIVLTPRELSATPTAAPYRLDGLTGSVLVLPDRISINDLTGRHGDATIRLSGAGSPDPGGKWDFKLSGRDVTADEELRKALPEALGEMVKSTDLKGKIAFDFSKLTLSPASGAAAVARAPTEPGASAATRPNDPPLDVDFAVKVNTLGASINLGVPMQNVTGAIDVAGTTRGGRLERLDGAVDFPSLSISGRPVTDLRAKLTKAANLPLLQVGKFEAQLAGGALAGQIDWAFPDNSVSRYALRLDLRGADVETLTGERADIHGRISASLALEGSYDDIKSRRGRGDVSVDGDKLLKLPLVLGLLQITNLALPIAEPFNQATARYSVEGERVTFEQLEMRAKDMLMQGSGHLDFGTKQVRMNFVTDSAAWAKVPIVGDLLKGARHELLQIQVRGTIKEPKVSASAMNTFTSTIDEVFRGDGRK